MAPNHSIVEQLVDVKRAIRWTRLNIETFGGDPTFIAIGGSDSGAHLALMAAMTPNNPTYQPNFETIDTAVQACVSLGGFYDLTRNWGYKFDQWVRDVVIGQRSDGDLQRQFSPVWLLKEHESQKSRVTATDEERAGPSFCPLLIIQ